METLFFTVLGMSGTASVVILVVLLARLVLRRAPKMFSYVLWTVVLFRLLCPFTFSSPWGIAPVRVEPAETNPPKTSTSTAGVVIRVDDAPVSHPESAVSFAPVEPLVIPDAPEPDIPAPAATPAALSWQTIAGFVWLTGVILLLGYSVVSLLLLRRRLIGSVPLAGENSVWLADHIPSPFVLGMVRPRIYLPSDLPESERDYILLHERTHIRRFDHVTRALAWIALAVHWFNPLVWLAFHLAGKDMEMSCDEAVLRKMGRDIRADYSTSLLRLSVGGKLPAGPLAFGGGDPQNRIKNVLKYKKPAFWVVVAAFIAVLCAGVALATNQSPFIDPDSIISFTSITGSSYTITTERTIVSTGEDIRKDLENPDSTLGISQEDGAELLDLINSYRKTIYGRGDLTLSGIVRDLVRMDCKDGSFYLLNYWYWNGFSLNPFHMGEDDYTTLITYYDAEGNAGTTWQMEYDFDTAFRDWYHHVPQARKDASRFRLDELADSLNADLTFTLDQLQLDGSPFVRISGTVDGVELSRAVWNPEGENSLLGEHPGGELTMEYTFAGGGTTLGAWWTDETHTSVTLSTKITTLYSSYKPDGWWEFTVDLATGTLPSIMSHPRESTLSDSVKMHPEFIAYGEPLQAARIMAAVMQAAEEYYNENTPETPALAVTYSITEGLFPNNVDISGLDCDGARWDPDGQYWFFESTLPDHHGAQGVLSVYHPRFFGGRFPEARGSAIVAYFPNESSPLLLVWFDDYVSPEEEAGTGKMIPDSTRFIVDMNSGAITIPDGAYDPVDSGLSDAETVALARALVQIIQGAADYYDENAAPQGDLAPTYYLYGSNDGVSVHGLDCDRAIWAPSGPKKTNHLSPFVSGETALGCLTIENPRFLGGMFKRATGTITTYYYPDAEFQLLNSFEGYTFGSSTLKQHSFLVDLNTGIGTHKEFSGFPSRTVPVDDDDILKMGRTLAQIIQGAADYYAQATGNSFISAP